MEEKVMETLNHRSLGVVLVPAPFQGHVNPMLHLGAILHSRGFSITVAHFKFRSPDTASHPEFHYLCIPDGLSEFTPSPEESVSLILKLNSNCQSSFKECLVQFMQQQEQLEKKIACIIYDEQMYLCEAAANHLKLPSIIFRTASAATFISRIALIQLQAQGCVPWQDSGLKEGLVPDFHPLRFKDLPTPIFASSESFMELIHKSHHIGTSSAIIWNTMDCMESSSLTQLQQHFQVPVFPVGPLHKLASTFPGSRLEEDTSCIEWLNKQTSNTVIYISLGSQASMSENEIKEMAWGLANSKQPFLWVIRSNSTDDKAWRNSLPEGFNETVVGRGCIVNWAPQREVLAHNAVGGFWSHCGWNSTLESISKGVPMICRPFFWDQMVNARYLTHVWRIGLEVEDAMDKRKIERAVRRLMVEKEGEQMRKRAMDFKQKVEICIRSGGSSHDSLNELVKFIMSF